MIEHPVIFSAPFTHSMYVYGVWSTTTTIAIITTATIAEIYLIFKKYTSECIYIFCYIHAILLCFKRYWAYELGVHRTTKQQKDRGLSLDVHNILKWLVCMWCSSRSMGLGQILLVSLIISINVNVLLQIWIGYLCQNTNRLCNADHVNFCIKGLVFSSLNHYRFQ